MYSTHNTHVSQACARFAESLDPPAPACGARPRAASAGARSALPQYFIGLSHRGCVARAFLLG
jgi:hypothetical protein